MKQQTQCKPTIAGPSDHPVCDELRRTLMRSARALKARIHDGGTYIDMEGPAFSTQAESILNHQAGHAVIGMTNLGEARCAREAEIAYATMAMVTDYDAWKPDEAHVTVDLVIENLRRNAEQAKAILAHAIPRIAHEVCVSRVAVASDPDAATCLAETRASGFVAVARTCHRAATQRRRTLTAGEMPAATRSMKTKERIRNACGILCRNYTEQYPVLHGNLSRFAGLLIMLNVTLARSFTRVTTTPFIRWACWLRSKRC